MLSVKLHIYIKEKAEHTRNVNFSKARVGKLQPAPWPPAFINKVLLEHHCAHSFPYCRWLLLCTKGRELSSCNRDCMALKA